MALYWLLTVIGSGPANGGSVEIIGGAVSRVLASEGFANSKRLQRFLAYIVEKTLAGQVDDVKEYNIALAVFDREQSFDPRLDSIVRVEARRLRQQLAAYYQRDGLLDPVVIDLPRGGYVPVFQTRNTLTVEKSTVKLPWRGLALAGAVVLATVAFFLWRSNIRVPHHWSLEGAKLKIFDARDRLCWEKQFPALNGDWDTFVRDKVVIGDIDGDGRVEVLFNLHPESQGEKRSSLLCFDHAGMVRWEFPFGSRKTFAGRAFDPSYAGRFFRLVRADGKSYVLTVANHKIWYPAQVALLDPGTGRLVEEYWHPGSIYEMALMDVDHDGEDEVLLGAINNPGEGLGHAALAVLDIPFSKAPRRPAIPGDQFPPATGGGELAYVLFPLPDVCRVMGHLPIISRFAVDQNRRIVVQTPLVDYGGIVYYLDSDLKVLEYRASDNFAAMHERYYRQHLLEHRLTVEETASLGRVVAFASAPNGNSPELERFWRY